MDLTQHVLNLAPGGALTPSGSHTTTPEDLAAIVQAFVASQRPSLTLHFHGGLVPEKDGLALAAALGPRLLADTTTYPLFVVWETGARETLPAALDAIAGTPVFGRIAGKLLAAVQRKLGVPDVGIAARALDDGAADDADVRSQGALAALDERLATTPPAPLDEAEQLRLARAIDGDEVLSGLMDRAAARASRRGAGLGLGVRALDADDAAPTADEAFLDAAVLDEWQGADGARGPALHAAGVGALVGLAARVVAVLVRVVGRFIAGTHHGVWPTIVEELLRKLYLAKLGAAGWDAMKRSAAGAYAPEAAGKPVPGGARLLDLLAAHAAAHPAFRLNLVGHSAGSIHIGHLLAARARAAATLRVARLALLAPACDFELFATTYVPAAADIGAFRTYNLTDAAERADPLIHHDAGRHVYPRSLLYLVSGALERDGKAADHPIFGMQRFHDPARLAADPHVAATRKFLVDRPGSVIACPGPDAGFALHYGRHGALAGPHEDAVTLASLVAFLGGA